MKTSYILHQTFSINYVEGFCVVTLGQQGTYTMWVPRAGQGKFAEKFVGHGRHILCIQWESSQNGTGTTLCNYVTLDTHFKVLCLQQSLPHHGTRIMFIKLQLQLMQYNFRRPDLHVAMRRRRMLIKYHIQHLAYSVQRAGCKV